MLGEKPIVTLLVSILLLTVLTYAQSPAVSAEVSCEPDEDSSFVLHVVLDDIFNPHRDLHLPIKLNMPFRLSRLSGKVKNTISGELRPCADGKYPLHLTISEWVSEKKNVSGTADYLLQLGKSDESGLIASVVYNRTVTLVRRADPLRKALARFRSETDVTVKENLLMSITSGYPNAGAALLETARNASTADTRWLAIRGIGYLKYQPAVPYLRAALRSKNSYVRANSARALGDMKATLAAQPLLDVLLHERNGGVIEQVSLALVELQYKSAVPALERKAQEPLPSQTKGWLLGAIGTLGSATDVPFVSKFLCDPDAIVAFAAASALSVLTKENFGFSSRPGPTDLSAPVKRAQEWWEKRKNEWH